MKLLVSTIAAFQASLQCGVGGRRAPSRKFMGLSSDEELFFSSSSKKKAGSSSSSTSSSLYSTSEDFDQEELKMMQQELEHIEKLEQGPSGRILGPSSSDEEERFSSSKTSSSSVVSDGNNLVDQHQPEEEPHYMQKELEHIEKLERLLREIKGFELEEGILAEDEDVDGDGDEDEEEQEEDFMMWDDESSLNDFLASISSLDDIEEVEEWVAPAVEPVEKSDGMESFEEAAARGLERALLQGVVPVTTTIGSECIPGDFGFDPLGLADRDLFLPTQQFILNLLPRSRWDDFHDATAEKDFQNLSPKQLLPRPKPLVLRDYRECEIRHGRICMLAATIWPLQEMLDRWILPPEEFGPLLSFTPSVTTTLPYFPLFMTACLLLLGYLDVYSQAIKDMDRLGEAFLPGDCFWDPLRILDGSSDRTKRIMQERELFNGRAAMMAVMAYSLEELVTKKPFIELDRNALLLEPAYQVPFIQKWLDDLFARNDPLFDSMDLYYIPDDPQSFLPLDDIMFLVI
jgi:light-harvesting complex I chlorophyll a/b binding protein 1